MQERLYKEFEKEFQGKARFLQKRVKGGDIKFQLLPTKEALEEGASQTKDPHTSANSAIEVDDDEDDPEEPQTQDPDKTVLQNVFSKV